MKLLLKRNGIGYEYVCPYRGVDKDQIIASLGSGTYTIVEVKGDILISANVAGSDFDKMPAPSLFSKEVADAYSNYLATAMGNHPKITPEAIRSISDLNERFNAVKSLGIEVSDDDLVFARNPNLYQGPNGEKAAGRLVKYNGKKYLLNNDLTLDDWNSIKSKTTQPTEKTDISETEKTELPAPAKTGPQSEKEQTKTSNPVLVPVHPAQSPEKDNKSFEEFVKVEDSKIPSDKSVMDKLAALNSLEKNGAFDRTITAQVKSDTKPLDSKPAVKLKQSQVAESVEFDEESAFDSLSADLAELNNLNLESLDDIESNDRQETQVNPQEDELNSVILEPDNLTVSVTYEGSLYRKKFKSEAAAKRQAETMASMIKENGIKEILTGPGSIYSKVN